MNNFAVFDLTLKEVRSGACWLCCLVVCLKLKSKDRDANVVLYMYLGNLVSAPC